MFTEDEAKKKWCPFVRVLEYGATPNRWGDGKKTSPQAMCIASQCMAWRKIGGKCRNRRGQLVDRDLDGTGDWQDFGYCGLAGKP